MKSFVEEIKRRRVFQVAAVYAVVAWLLIQIVTSVKDPLNLPVWTDTFVIVILGIGFPIAVILSWAFDLTAQGITVTSKSEPDVPRSPHPANLFTYIVQGLVLISVGFLIVDQYVLDAGPQTRDSGSLPDGSQVVARLSLLPPQGMKRDLGTNSPSLAISPDGRLIVYRATIEQQPALVLRTIESLQSTVLYSGDVYTPFFSPDGLWVAFNDQDDQSLKRIPVAGGPALQIASIAGRLAGAVWTEGDQIVFSGVGLSGLHSVPATGGEPVQLTIPDESAGEVDHSWPALLPNRDAVLFSIRYASRPSDERDIAVRNLENGEQRILIQGGSYPRYVRTGHVVYGYQGTLRAFAFDTATLSRTGNPVTVLDNVNTKRSGGAEFAIADNGTVVYTSFDDSSTAVGIVWVDRLGNEEPSGVSPDDYRDLRLSPDSSRMALTLRERDGFDIFIATPQSGTLTQLTTGEGDFSTPVWSADGVWIAYWSLRKGIYRRRADGIGTPELLYATPNQGSLSDWTADGQLVFTEFETEGQLRKLAVNGEHTVTTLVDSLNTSANATVSPDGRWLAYEVRILGRYELRVRPFPDIDAGQWIVLAGARSEFDRQYEPTWSPDGRTLYFNGATHLMAAAVGDGPAFEWQMPEPLLDHRDYRLGKYGVSSDGGLRIAMLKSVASETRDGTPDTTVALNWFVELQRLVPAD